MSSMGTTCEYPPPAAPPLTPNTGPSDGSRIARIAFFPMRRSAWATPTVTVDFPSPAGVGLMPVTRTRRPLGWRAASAPRVILALCLPYSSISSSLSPSSAATSAIGRNLAAWAMAMSVGTLAAVVTMLEGLQGGVQARPEQAARIGCRAGGHGIQALAAEGGRARRHLPQERRLVAPPAVRHGRQVRGVRLDQQPVGWTGGEPLGLGPVLERDHAA